MLDKLRSANIFYRDMQNARLLCSAKAYPCSFDDDGYLPLEVRYDKEKCEYQKCIMYKNSRQKEMRLKRRV